MGKNLRRGSFIVELMMRYPRKTMQNLRVLPSFLRDLSELLDQQHRSKVYFPLTRPYPCYRDRFSESGMARGHYFHQDLLVARKIFTQNPKLHVDIGSRIDGFVAHVASFRQIEIMDIRRLQSNIPNIRFIQCDLMNDLDKSLVDYCDSLSCLHALEHFGLGRYGDPVNFEGYLKGLDNMLDILKRNGTLYLSVPIGPQRIEFNAHRVFSMRYLLAMFKDRLSLKSFSYVDDRGDLHEDAVLSDEDIDHNFGCRYGCGIFEMTNLKK